MPATCAIRTNPPNGRRLRWSRGRIDRPGGCRGETQDGLKAESCREPKRPFGRPRWWDRLGGGGGDLPVRVAGRRLSAFRWYRRGRGQSERDRKRVAAGGAAAARTA